mmetsp:Transcript_4793/g.8255  ORF Transcript_4793/g.8255 Transcript_4793/m.8255 type:complete len:227 (-) Transcript_4793:615-1295(-)
MRRMDRVPMRRVLREIAILLPFLREYCQVMFLLLVLSLEVMPLPWVEIWAALLLVLVEEEAIPLLNMAEWIPTWTQSLPWHSESVWRRNVLGRNEFQLRQQNPTKRRNLVMVKMMQLLQTTQNQWRGLLLGLRMMRMPCCSKHLQCQWQKIRLLVLLRKLLLLQEKVLLWTWVTTTTMQRCKWPWPCLCKAKARRRRTLGLIRHLSINYLDPCLVSTLMIQQFRKR